MKTGKTLNKKPNGVSFIHSPNAYDAVAQSTFQTI